MKSEVVGVEQMQSYGTGSIIMTGAIFGEQKKLVKFTKGAPRGKKKCYAVTVIV